MREYCEAAKVKEGVSPSVREVLGGLPPTARDAEFVHGFVSGWEFYFDGLCDVAKGWKGFGYLRKSDPEGKIREDYSLSPSK